MNFFVLQEAVASTRLSHGEGCKCNVCRGTLAEAVERAMLAEATRKPKRKRKVNK